MGMTVEALKEHGKYIGFFKDIGYIYELGNKIYTYSRNGIMKL